MQAAHSTSAPTDPVLKAADRLFYRHGVKAVGMDALREEAGVSLRRLYRLYPSKEILVAAYLRRRDERWRSWLRQSVQRYPQPPPRPLAVFDALAEWFADKEFRGCALVNASAELGDSTPAVRRQAQDHKRAVRVYLSELLRESGRLGDDADDLSAQLMLLVDGAIVQASIAGDGAAAQRAKDMAERLLSAYANRRADPAGARRRT